MERYPPSSTESMTRQTYLNAGLRTQDCTLGAIPPQAFLDKFLPSRLDVSTKHRKHVLHHIPTRHRCKPLAKALGELCPDLEFVSLSPNTSHNLGHKSPHYPEIAALRRGSHGRPSFCDWSRMDLLVEWRPDEFFDGYRSFFDGDNQTLYDDSVQARESRGRLFTFAARLMDSQHRLFVFAVDIFGDKARLYRFDPSCVVISDIIHFRKDPAHLDEFFARYSLLSPTQRGYDPTVVPTSALETALFHSGIAEYFERARRLNLRTHPDVKKLDGEVVKIQVNDQRGKSRWYLASRCSTSPVNSLPCGRFTRGFIAVPLASGEHGSHKSRARSEKGRLFWLKDNWRPSSSESEVSVHRRLKAKGVPNLPDIACGGDVSVSGIIQETIDDTILAHSEADSWLRPLANGTIQHMIHHRIVSGILIPLDHVKNAKDLLLTGRDVLKTIAATFHKAKVYHRDISKGNLMMTEQQGLSDGPWGVLNDWDRAGKVGDKVGSRTGTWQFMSILHLEEMSKPHDIFDDLESLLWVLLFFAIHHFEYEGSFNMRVFNELHETEDTTHGTYVTGGSSKTRWLAWPRIKFKCQPLQNFFDSFRTFHHQHHHKISLSFDDPQQKQALEEYEAEVEKDVYALVSHFDMILNDPSVDWTGSEVPGTEDLLLDAQQDGHIDVPVKSSSDPEDPKPIPKSQKRVENNRKRKRDPEEGDLVKTRRPRVAVVARM